ncbi:MAG: glycerate kinase [Thermodesulfobacteriota bacterium]
MTSATGETGRSLAHRLFEAALQAVQPEALVRGSVRIAGDTLWIGAHVVELRPDQRLWVFGSGKASAAMASAVEAVLGDRLAGGQVVCSHLAGQHPRCIEVLLGDHPVPSEASVQSTTRLWQSMTSLGEEDFFLFLLSGGSSALLELPLPPLTLAEVQQVTTMLLHRGVAIEGVNTVRKHLSLVKGGRLGAAVKASGAVLVLSDVIGDDFATIGSGPLFLDPTTFADAHRVLQEHALWQEVPERVRAILSEGCQGGRPDTPKAVNPRVSHHLIGSNTLALQAAKRQAEEEGTTAHVMTSRLHGEAREVARVLVALASEIRETGNPFPAPVALLFGGETTVTVTGRGRGGRNQELALAALLEIGDTDGIRLLAAGTDGIDGNSTAAGAVADATIWRQTRAQGLDPASFLADNDANTLFSRAGGLVVTGPTGTNVMDIVILTIEPKEAP